MKFQKFLPDEAATEAFGAELAQSVLSSKKEVEENGLNIRLQGDLGAGKTCLTRALLRAAGFEGRVKSPTFTLLEPYRIHGMVLNHFDFYRFEDPEEFEDAGFRENFGPGKICMTEWSQKAEPFLPAADIEIRLTSEGDGRNVSVESVTETGSAVLSRLTEHD